MPTADRTPRVGTAGVAIGPYTLIEPLGEGGFGVVWSAEQTEPVRRRVALKLIKPGMDSAQVQARFEAERQALAFMDHPHVAKVLDGGVTDEGRPYFVMELVHGEPITSFCDKHRLGLGERLELFILVCLAVQHAHAKGLIHRDLKPSNILVGYGDEGPAPKIIDFGVAKALNQRLTERSLFTERGQLIGTPEYMSPEQAEMSGLDVDTRSDVYTLGVVLYELLAGHLPFDPASLRSAGIAEIQRIIREVDPPKPSTRLATLLTSDAASASAIAEHRHADPRTLSRRLRGDLDWIVMKCLEKDRVRRYATASDLAGELRRFLADEPVHAGPPGARYRLGKFLRRHKASTTVAVTVVAAVVAVAVLSTAAWRSESVQRHRAEAAVAEADQLLDRLSALVLESHSSETLTESDLLDESEVARAYAGDPAREAAARVELAVDANRSGRARAVLHHVERALELLGDAPTQTRLDALTLAGIASRRVGRFEDSERYAREALALGESMYGEKGAEVSSLRNNLAVVLRQGGRLEEAVTLLERVLADRTASAGPDDRRTLRTRRSLVAALRQAGEIDQAIEKGRALVDRSTELFGAVDPDTLAAQSNLGVALIGVDAMEAERVLREALSAALEVFGVEDMRTAIVRQNLARALRVRGLHGQAEQQLREAIAVQFGLGRVDDPEVFKMLVDRADSLVVLGRHEPALSVLTVAEALGRRLEARDDLWPDVRRDVTEELSRAAELRQHAESR